MTVDTILAIGGATDRAVPRQAPTCTDTPGGRIAGRPGRDSGGVSCPPAVSVVTSVKAASWRGDEQ